MEGDAMRTMSSNGNQECGYLKFTNIKLEEPSAQTAATKNNMSYKFTHVESKLVRMILDAHGFKEEDPVSESFNVIWSSGHPKPEKFQQLQTWQKVNHFPKSSELTRKDCLQMNIRQMQQQFGDSYNIMSNGFIVPDERDDLIVEQKREPGTWIVKPVAAAQGKGIYLVQDVDKISNEENSVVCRYIESPFLLDGFKCDLRLYVAVTSIDPLVIYLYEEGLVRLASVKYDQGKDIWNPCIHLTNYSVNKYHSDYVKNEDSEKDNEGNKWSLSAFLCHLESKGIDTCALMQSVEDVIIKALLAAGKKMNIAKIEQVPHYNNCFELYGVDIMIDNQLRPWLLEFNLSPGLNIETPLDLRLKSAMLAELFTMVGIQVKDPASKDSSNQQFNSSKESTKHITTIDENENISSAYIPRKLSLLDELKIFQEVREESKHCGGWQRIFPTPDSQRLYGGIQEYKSSLNKALHQSLYLQLDISSTRVKCVVDNREEDLRAQAHKALLQRCKCYERHMTKVLSDERCKVLISGEKDFSKDEVKKMKTNVMKAMTNGLRLSKYEARMAFSIYLTNLQQQLMNGINGEAQVKVVHSFLCNAVKQLHHPFIVQDPDVALPPSAQAIILCKQLGDFIQAYTKETHLYLGQNTKEKEERNIHVKQPLRDKNGVALQVKHKYDNQELVDSDAPPLHRELARTILQHNIFSP